MIMTMTIFITIAIEMMTKFISRSHNICLDVYDNNIHKVRNVFVTIDADDVVII